MARSNEPPFTGSPALRAALAAVEGLSGRDSLATVPVIPEADMIAAAQRVADLDADLIRRVYAAMVATAETPSGPFQ